jgi:hypothetical protein
MPHSIFFHNGYAIHGTTEIKRLGRIASHGCVRLHPENAEKLYSLVAKEMATTRIVVSNDVIDAPAQAPTKPKKKPSQYVAEADDTPKRGAMASARKETSVKAKAVAEATAGPVSDKRVTTKREKHVVAKKHAASKKTFAHEPKSAKPGKKFVREAVKHERRKFAREAVKHERQRFAREAVRYERQMFARAYRGGFTWY